MEPQETLDNLGKGVLQDHRARMAAMVQLEMLGQQVHLETLADLEQMVLLVLQE
ncbi:hypothetical protein D4764_12G0000020 [Takifugu flavidus]|uniref:Uncharacterized protein n=1 Tax=Takifugu flavidus TaxID=433684 RepID=A0A5C6PA38_9TELE|nr:hypothetical protein D4764_12G0000020 [Takifugu flavidus]